MPPRRPIIIAHHVIIMTGYGHWLPNDPRGSGSRTVQSESLRKLGPLHLGRERVQPSRQELRSFLRKAEEILNFPVIWFDDAKRQAIADGFAAALAANRYTCYACAILRNHTHLLIRRHRDDGQTICEQLAGAAIGALREAFAQLRSHPIWGRDNYDGFLDRVERMWEEVDYVNRNPAKEGLPDQHWAFVTPYDGWPHPRKP